VVTTMRYTNRRLLYFTLLYYLHISARTASLFKLANLKIYS